MKLKVLFSLIVPILNDSDTINELIVSINKQSFRDFEIIFVCSDCSIKYKEKLSKSLFNIQTTILDIPSKGVYNAFNYGIKNAKGQFLYFIGDDDLILYEDLFWDLSFKIKRINYKKLVCFNVINSSKKLFKSALSFKTLLFNTIHHQGVIYPIQIFKKYKYNEELKAISDYELNLKLFLQGYKSESLNKICVKVSNQGISNTIHKIKILNEFNKSRINAIPKKYYIIALFLNSIFCLYYFYKNFAEFTQKK